jgi:hypothetical protein
MASSSASGQIRHPPRWPVDGLGACEASGTFGPRFAIATNGLTTVDCTVGGGATPAPCWCDGSAWVPLLSAGGDVSSVFTRTGAVVAEAGDYDAPLIDYTPADGADWTDPDPTTVEQGLDDLAAREDTDTAAGYTFTGLDTSIVTGTLGTSGDCAEWNIDGDLVGSGAACGGGGGIGGSTGATDNAVPRADGTGGATLQASTIIINDAGQLLAPAVAFQTPNISSVAGPTTGFNLGRTGAVNDIEVDIAGTRSWWWASTGDLGVASTARGALMVAANGHIASTPAYGFRNDPNTGMRTSATPADTAALVAGGSDALGWSTTAVTNLRAIFQQTPQATAPATCVAATDFYTDTSGALCFCSITNTWEQLNAVGSCA